MGRDPRLRRHLVLRSRLRRRCARSVRGNPGLGCRGCHAGSTTRSQSAGSERWHHQGARPISNSCEQSGRNRRSPLSAGDHESARQGPRDCTLARRGRRVWAVLRNRRSRSQRKRVSRARQPSGASRQVACAEYGLSRDPNVTGCSHRPRGPRGLGDPSFSCSTTTFGSVRT